MFAKWFSPRVVLIMLGIVLAALISGCSAGTSNPGNEKTVIYGAVTDPYSLNPLIGADAACTEMQSLMFNALVKINGQKEVIGDLAQRWQVDEQQKKYTFCLNRQVEWHDGYKLTSRDVKLKIHFGEQNYRKYWQIANGVGPSPNPVKTREGGALFIQSNFILQVNRICLRLRRRG